MMLLLSGSMVAAGQLYHVEMHAQAFELLRAWLLWRSSARVHLESKSVLLSASADGCKFTYHMIYSVLTL